MLSEDEYHPYFKTYIDHLTKNGLSIIENLIETSSELEEVVAKLPKEKELFVYAEGKWTIKELLLHIIDTERIFIYRALRFARNDTTDLQGFDQDDYNDNVDANGRELQDLLEEFITVRASSISLFKSFSSEALVKIGTASGTAISVRAIGYLMSGHQQHHIKIFKERYL
tara:strand:- start:108 stop:617 length:510 start_codon:yes stop_codon:yes gene_type:complete